MVKIILNIILYSGTFFFLFLVFFTTFRQMINKQIKKYHKIFQQFGEPIKNINYESENKELIIFTFNKNLFKKKKHNELFYRVGDKTYLAFDELLYQKIINNNKGLDSFFLNYSSALDKFVISNRIRITITTVLYVISLILMYIFIYLDFLDFLLITIIYYSVNRIIRFKTHEIQMKSLYLKYL
ncbi:hypothetical protein RJG79_04545 [Mycoplasmatota bacterium WC44]